MNHIRKFIFFEYIKQMQNEGYSVFVVSGELSTMSSWTIELLCAKLSTQSILFIDLTNIMRYPYQRMMNNFNVSFKWVWPIDKVKIIIFCPKELQLRVEAALKLNLECFGCKGKLRILIIILGIDVQRIVGLLFDLCKWKKERNRIHLKRECCASNLEMLLEIENSTDDKEAHLKAVNQTIKLQ